LVHAAPYGLANLGATTTTTRLETAVFVSIEVAVHPKDIHKHRSDLKRDLKLDCCTERAGPGRENRTEEDACISSFDSVVMLAGEIHSRSGFQTQKRVRNDSDRLDNGSSNQTFEHESQCAVGAAELALTQTNAHR
jgi:hypothetical protein